MLDAFLHSFLSFRFVPFLFRVPTAVDAHLAFWDAYLAKEHAFFKSGRFLDDKGTGKGKRKGGRGKADDDHDDRIVLQFRPFIKQQLQTMRDVYEGWGWAFDGTPFLKRLEAAQEANKNYKGGGHGE